MRSTSNAGRKPSAEASPTACIIDSQSVKSAEKGWACIDPPGFDAGKLIKGKKRHVLVDTQGLLLHGIVTAAEVQDRDGGLTLLASLFGLFPFLSKTCSPTSAYQGPIFHRALADILAPSRDRDRQAIRSGHRLCRAAQALDRRTLHRLAQPLSPAGQRLGKPQTATHSAFSSSLESASCSENSVILHKVSGRTLSVRPRSFLVI